MICSIQKKRLSELSRSINSAVSSLTLGKSFLIVLSVFAASLLIVKFSHTQPDFSRLLKVIISESRISCHFILVFLSSTLMKRLTCHVVIFSRIRIFGMEIQ